MPMGPPIPDFIDRVNFIVRYFWDGCEAPFRLFVEFAGPPAGQAVALLIGLSWDDIAKGFFRPAGLRSKRHGRKGYKGGKRGWELPDPNDEIARRIPGQREFAGRPWGSPTFWAFEISDVADRVAFNLAIVDVVSDVTYQALLGIIEADQSNCPWMARGKSHVGHLTHLTSGGHWQNTGIPIIDYEYRLEMVEHGCELPGSAMYMVAMNMMCWQDWHIPSTTKIGLLSVNTGEIVGESPEITLGQDEAGGISCSAMMRGPDIVQWMIFNEGWHVQSSETNAIVLQAGKE
jgi:hypothetical protein